MNNAKVTFERMKLDIILLILAMGPTGTRVPQNVFLVNKL